MENNYWEQLENVQGCITEITDRILLLQLERQRYEQMGHKLVELIIKEQVDGLS